MSSVFRSAEFFAERKHIIHSCRSVAVFVRPRGKQQRTCIIGIVVLNDENMAHAYTRDRGRHLYVSYWIKPESIYLEKN